MTRGATPGGRRDPLRPARLVGYGALALGVVALAAVLWVALASAGAPAANNATGAAGKFFAALNAGDFDGAAAMYSPPDAGPDKPGFYKQLSSYLADFGVPQKWDVKTSESASPGNWLLQFSVKFSRTAEPVTAVMALSLTPDSQSPMVRRFVVLRDTRLPSQIATPTPINMDALRGAFGR